LTEIQAGEDKDGLNANAVKLAQHLIEGSATKVIMDDGALLRDQKAANPTDGPSSLPENFAAQVQDRKQTLARDAYANLGKEMDGMGASLAARGSASAAASPNIDPAHLGTEGYLGTQAIWDALSAKAPATHAATVTAEALDETQSAINDKLNAAPNASAKTPLQLAQEFVTKAHSATNPDKTASTAEQLRKAKLDLFFASSGDLRNALDETGAKLLAAISDKDTHKQIVTSAEAKHIDLSHLGSETNLAANDIWLAASPKTPPVAPAKAAKGQTPN
jgi:hypothetical protein